MTKTTNQYLEQLGLTKRRCALPYPAWDLVNAQGQVVLERSDLEEINVHIKKKLAPH